MNGTLVAVVSFTVNPSRDAEAVVCRGGRAGGSRGRWWRVRGGQAPEGGAGGELVAAGLVEGVDDGRLAAGDRGRNLAGVGVGGADPSQVGVQGLDLLEGSLVAAGLDGRELASGDSAELFGVLVGEGGEGRVRGEAGGVLAELSLGAGEEGEVGWG